jgi:sporulation protein YlmC with PRC-barrel domain
MEQDRDKPLEAARAAGSTRTNSSDPAGSRAGGTTYDEGGMTEGMSSAADAGSSPRGSTGAREMASGATGERIRSTPSSEASSEGPGPRIMAADTLEGDDVVNDAGEDLGEVKHIMIDVPSGRVAYAVLSFGGFLGMGDKLFAIPWQALELDTENKCFVLNVDKERLREAPGFDEDHWPSMADQGWADEIHRYYGTRPYWE